MGNILLAVLLICSAATLIVLVLSLTHGSGAKHKKLKKVAFLLGIVLLVRFGGGAVLSLGQMGWRCTPRNLLDLLWMILMAVTIYRAMMVFSERWLKNQRAVAAATLCGFHLLLTIVGCGWLHFTFHRWSDWETEESGQRVVVEKLHDPGSYSARRYYRYVNGIVHGESVEFVRGNGGEMIVIGNSEREGEKGTW